MSLAVNKRKVSKVFIDQKLFELENPRLLLRYITDESLRKTAETLINVKLKPIVNG